MMAMPTFESHFCTTYFSAYAMNCSLSLVGRKRKHQKKDCSLTKHTQNMANFSIVMNIIFSLYPSIHPT